MGNNGKDCAFKWVRKTENAVQRPKNESTFNGGIVVAVPVLSIELLLNHLVLFLVVITEIELAGNNIILHSNHRFKEFECARMRFDFHCESLVVEMKKIIENCMNLSAGSVRVQDPHIPPRCEFADPARNEFFACDSSLDRPSRFIRH